NNLLRAEAVQGHLETERLVDRFRHEMLDRLLAERREHVLVETTTETLCAGESDAFEFERFRFFQNSYLCRTEDLLHFFRVPALMIVIAENGNDRDTAYAQIVCQSFSFSRQTELRQIPAKRKNIGVL